MCTSAHPPRCGPHFIVALAWRGCESPVLPAFGASLVVGAGIVCNRDAAFDRLARAGASY